VRVGIDIGGTFTDMMILDPVRREVRVHKLPTTHGDPAEAVEDGFKAVLELAGAAASQVEEVRHGTTLVTNAVLERRGARTALIVTVGFRDVLTIGTEARYDMYDLQIERVQPIIPRKDVYAVAERILVDGSVLEPLRQQQLTDLVEALRAGGYDSVAICLLHSYRNAAHEEKLAEHLREHLPGVEVSYSYDISPEVREYFRASTTAINAYVVPLMKAYLARLRDRIRATGANSDLYLMLSNGGICTVEMAETYPVRLIESGPAAGALAAAEIATRSGEKNVLSFDMGGTSAKACLVVDGEPLFTPNLEVARHYRFKAGSGLPLQVRSVDLIEIGAGGGSIASINEVGLVEVGPESAESEPGPACYGRGGDRATVTDADLVLGYLNPDYFLGGVMRLDEAAARAAIDRDVGGRLGMDTIEAAEAIRSVVNENMASAARIYAIEHGYDLADFPMVGFGGAGPVHASGVARIIGVSRVLIPPGAGVSSTYGLLAAPLAFDFVRSDQVRLSDIDWDLVNRHYQDMEHEGRAILTRAGVPEDKQRVLRLCDARFVGQGTELSVEVPDGKLSGEVAQPVEEAFTQQYSQLYRRVPGSVPVEVISWRAIVSGPRSPLVLTEEGSPEGSPVKGTRSVFWGRDAGFQETTVHDRYALSPGDTYPGPAIVEEREATTAVDPGARLRVDEHMNLVVELS
jgi:N-methylhydantoinase A